MHMKRVVVFLSEEELAAIDGRVGRGSRSAFIRGCVQGHLVDEVLENEVPAPDNGLEGVLALAWSRLPCDERSLAKRMGVTEALAGRYLRQLDGMGLIRWERGIAHRGKAGG